MDDPEGNLVIVERIGHESQRHFPYWEHSWVGTAHVLNSTRYGTHTSHARHFPRLDKHCIRRAASTPPLHFGAFPSIYRRLTIHGDASHVKAE